MLFNVWVTLCECMSVATGECVCARWCEWMGCFPLCFSLFSLYQTSEMLSEQRNNNRVHVCVRANALFKSIVLSVALWVRGRACVCVYVCMSASERLRLLYGCATEHIYTLKHHAAGIREIGITIFVCKYVSVSIQYSQSKELSLQVCYGAVFLSHRLHSHIYTAPASKSIVTHAFLKANTGRTQIAIQKIECERGQF